VTDRIESFNRHHGFLILILFFMKASQACTLLYRIVSCYYRKIRATIASTVVCRTGSDHPIVQSRFWRGRRV
jgi:hypothetical protein